MLTESDRTLPVGNAFGINVDVEAGIKLRKKDCARCGVGVAVASGKRAIDILTGILVAAHAVRKLMLFSILKSDCDQEIHLNYYGFSLPDYDLFLVVCGLVFDYLYPLSHKRVAVELHACHLKRSRALVS